MSATPEPVGTPEIAPAHTRHLLDRRPVRGPPSRRGRFYGSPPRQPLAQFLLGLAYSATGQGDEAIAALRRTVELKPDLPDAWRTLADHLTAAG